LVRRAAALAADSESLRRTLAAHLDKPELRSSFLRRTGDALSPAGGGTISSSGAAGMVAPPPADLIPTEALVAAQGVLAEQIGPIAALIVKRAASEATSPVHFIEKIAAQVPIDERLRGRLHDAMQGNLRH
jgi:serine/threonine-protein kinase